MGIMQDPMTSIGDTPLFRGLAARRNPFLHEFMIDCPPRRLDSTVFVKTSDALFSLPGSFVDEDLTQDVATEAGCMPKFTSNPNLGCTGKEWGVGRHRGHHIEGRFSEAWRVEFKIHDSEGLDEL